MQSSASVGFAEGGIVKFLHNWRIRSAMELNRREYMYKFFSETHLIRASRRGRVKRAEYSVARTFRKNVYIFKARNDFASFYLAELFIVPTCSCLKVIWLSYSVCPTFTYKSIGDRSSCMTAPRAWNYLQHSLPTDGLACTDATPGTVSVPLRYYLLAAYFDVTWFLLSPALSRFGSVPIAIRALCCYKISLNGELCPLSLMLHDFCKGKLLHCVALLGPVSPLYRADGQHWVPQRVYRASSWLDAEYLLVRK